MAARARSLSAYRDVLKEFKRIYQEDPRNPTVQFFKGQFQKYEGTSEKYCRAQEEMQHMAQTYSCLLRSTRKHDELTEMYKGKGERSAEEAAAMVGLRLPEKKTDPENGTS